MIAICIHRMTTAAKFQLWHHRLGCPGETTTKAAPKHLDDCQVLKYNPFLKCNCCMKVKATYTSVPTNPKQVPKQDGPNLDPPQKASHPEEATHRSLTAEEPVEIADDDNTDDCKDPDDTRNLTDNQASGSKWTCPRRQWIWQYRHHLFPGSSQHAAQHCKRSQHNGPANPPAYIASIHHRQYSGNLWHQPYDIWLSTDPFDKRLTVQIDIGGDHPRLDSSYHNASTATGHT